VTRCKRCGVPSPDDPDSAADGGVSQREIEGGHYCLACISYIREHPAELEDLPVQWVKMFVEFGDD
jgi:DNA gyrase inhibitor GyrI